MDTKEHKLYGLLIRELTVFIVIAIAFACLCTALAFYLIRLSTGFSLAQHVQPGIGLLILLSIGVVTAVLFYLLFSRYIYAYFYITLKGDTIEIRYKKKEWIFGIDEIDSFVFSGSFNTSNLFVQTNKEVVKIMFESVSPNQNIWTGIKGECQVDKIDELITDLQAVFIDKTFSYTDIRNRVNGFEIFNITYQKK